jgi:hypothetical protein
MCAVSVSTIKLSDFGNASGSQAAYRPPPAQPKPKSPLKCGLSGRLGCFQVKSSRSNASDWLLVAASLPSDSSMADLMYLILSSPPPASN